MSRFILRELEPQVPSGISCRYFAPDRDQTKRKAILITQFAGVYPDGSRGNAHGHFIATATLHGLMIFNADCVILDFRELSYRWGNTLLQVFQDISQWKDQGKEPDEPFFPVLAVTSELSRAAFLSLVTPADQEPPSWHFSDMDSAIDAGIKAANAWADYI